MFSIKYSARERLRRRVKPKQDVSVCHCSLTINFSPLFRFPLTAKTCAGGEVASFKDFKSCLMAI